MVIRIARVALLILIASFMLAGRAHGGASSKEWRRIRDEARKQYEEAYPRHWKSFEARFEAMKKIGRADRKEAVDFILDLFGKCNARIVELEKEREYLRRKITGLLRGGTIKKLNEFNEKLNAALGEIYFHNRVKGRTSDALAFCASQVKYLAGPVLRKGDWEITVEVLQALATIRTEPGLRTIRDAVHHKDYQVRTEALELSLKLRLEEMGDVYIRALADEFWQVRATAIRAAIEKKMYRAVGPLVDALQMEDGRLTRELDDALHALTGKRFYGDAELWRCWWKENREAFEDAVAKGSLPGREDEKKEPAKKPLTTTSFYGIDTASKNIVFVLDVSGSMSQKSGRGQGVREPGERGEKKDPGSHFQPKNDSKLEIARCELKRAIANLPEDAFYNIVFYSTNIYVYLNTVVQATDANKKKTYKYVDRIRVGSRTNIHGALDMAFRIVTPERVKVGVKTGKRSDRSRKVKRVNRGGVDTIFFLTDGKATAGPLKLSRDILIAVKLWNATRGIVIHAVGIGDHDVDFLQELASSSGGKYVRK